MYLMNGTSFHVENLKIFLVAERLIIFKNEKNFPLPFDMEHCSVCSIIIVHVAHHFHTILESYLINHLIHTLKIE